MTSKYVNLCHYRPAESDKVVVAFGGLMQRIAGEPPFEFLRSLGHRASSIIFITDPERSWYQAGVDGLGGTLEESAHHLGARLESDGVTRVATLGTSAGGFAALAFGALLGVDAAFAFAPQTTLAVSDLETMNDRRWGPQLAAMRNRTRGQDQCLDCRPLLLHSTARCQIFVGGRNLLDQEHARRLQGLENVEVVVVGTAGHNTAAALRDEGTLHSVLSDWLR